MFVHYWCDTSGDSSLISFVPPRRRNIVVGVNILYISTIAVSLYEIVHSLVLFMVGVSL